MKMLQRRTRIVKVGVVIDGIRTNDLRAVATELWQSWCFKNPAHVLLGLAIIYYTLWTVDEYIQIENVRRFEVQSVEILSCNSFSLKDLRD